MPKKEYIYYAKEFHGIQELVKEKKYHKALEYYENYIEKYPKDSGARVYFADLLIKLGEFDRASKMLNAVDYNQCEFPLYHIIVIKLHAYRGEFQEAYDYILKNQAILNMKKHGFLCDYIYLKKQVGLLTEDDVNTDLYVFNQIYQYSDEAFLEHAYRHTYFEGNENPCQFVKDFPLEEVIELIKANCKKENRTYSSITDSEYLFKYDGNGTVNGKLVNYIEAVTFNDTGKLITLYPYENAEKNHNYIDLSLLQVPKKEEKPSKTRRLSQIDKFNQKYNCS